MFLRTAMLAAAGLLGSTPLASAVEGFRMPRTDSIRDYTFRPFTDRNIGRNWRKYGSGRPYAPNGGRERARRIRQIEAGQLRRENGLKA